MNLAFLCRYGHQDAARLLGVRTLNMRQAAILAACIAKHIESEVEPLQNMTNGGSSETG